MVSQIGFGFGPLPAVPAGAYFLDPRSLQIFFDSIGYTASSAGAFAIVVAVSRLVES